MSTTRPLPPNDVEYYIGKTKEKASQQGRELSKVKEMRKDLVEETYAEIDRLRAQKMLEEVRRGVINNTGQNPILTSLFQGKSPDQINEMLEKMTPQAIERLYQLASRMDGSNNVNAVLQPQQQAPQKSDAEILIQAIRLVKELQPPPQQGNSAKEIVDALVTGMKMANPQGGGGAMEVVKLASELNKPVMELMGRTTETANRKDKEIMDLKMKELENKMPQDPIETIKYVKEVAGTLGLSGSAKNEIDLKLEEMRQDREIDMKRLDWEQKKYELESDAELQKWEQIGKIFEGPIGKAIQSIGNAGADRVRPHGSGSAPINTPKAVQTQCPNCQRAIFVDADAPTAICGNCGAFLQKHEDAPEQPAPQQPEPTRVADNQPEAPAAASEEKVEEETDELRNENTEEEPEQQ